MVTDPFTSLDKSAITSSCLTFNSPGSILDFLALPEADD